ncbi:MAG: rhodanese-like domain-containing protein [Ferruginibacter sp.]|nr:rhodanese-like domain-containing protein [Ferruginibacter sp.]
MKLITAAALQHKIQDSEDFILIDVREEFEHDHFNIGGKLMPMGTVLSNINNIPKDKDVIFYCEKGIRSSIVIQRLQEKFGYTNLINLTGGMQAWRRETVE